MSEKLRNRLTSYLGTAVIFTLVFGVFATIINIPVAYAAAPTMTAVASDQNSDGSIDRIVITFSEASDIIDGNAGDGLASLGLGSGCTIPNADYAADNTTTLTLDNLTGCTPFDTSITPSVTYTAVASCATANAICDDALANQMANAETTNATDGAAPIIRQHRYYDTDNDGMIDQIQLRLTEDIVIGSTFAAANLTLSNVGDFTGAVVGADAVDLVTGTVSSISVDLGTESTEVDTYDDSTNLAISTAGVFTLTDAATNTYSTATGQSQSSAVDRAKPVITSATPTDASSVQSRTNAVVYNFSEPMAADTWAHATDFTSTPDPGGWSGSILADATSITLTHAPFLCIQAYSIAFTNAEIEAANGDTGYTILKAPSTTPIGVAHTFTTMSCGTASTSATESTETTYEIDVLTPNGGEELTEGEEYEITWEASPEGMYYIDLYYLGADGEYVEIATGETNDGSYDWTVPADVEDSMIKVVWTDLAEELDSDTSDADFNDTDGETAADDDTADDETADDSTEEAMAPSGTGISPVTGEEEEITAVEPGDYITSPSFSTVYYVTESYERRAFISSAVFFTYADSYDEIMDVTDAT
ncbi:hypothetical protein HN358_01720, partial [Candidatus Uhrbacteria bacterium]|nr:hypothetical protein [Candidatus Uhrbacteria bacterium]